MAAIFVVTCLFSADPTLTLVANRDEIRQGDYVVVKAVLLNNTDIGVSVEHPGIPSRNRIRYELKMAEKWMDVPAMCERNGVGIPGPAPDPIVEVNATYAQYDSIQLIGKDGFVFDKPGDYQLRAVGKANGARVESKPITIKVQARGPAYLRMIKEAKDDLYLLGCQHLERKVPERLIALKEVGGNIAGGVENLLLMERITSGEERTGESVFNYIRQRTDPTSAQVDFIILGYHYHKNRDFESLAKVVEALPDQSMIVWEWSVFIAFRNHRVPQVVVPAKPE
jgi:hypothetical protein